MAVATEAERQELAARQEKLRPWVVGGLTLFLVLALGKVGLDWIASLSGSKAAPASDEQEWAMQRAAKQEFSDS